MSLVTYKGAVYPWQCDHIGHMNVMWYVGKFDEANWNFLATLGLTPTYFAERCRGMAAVQENIAYKMSYWQGISSRCAAGRSRSAIRACAGYTRCGMARHRNSRRRVS
jgi:acyl-CoA thioester hydrolase